MGMSLGELVSSVCLFLRSIYCLFLGSVMIIVFVFLLPLAAIIARYYREVFHENWFKVQYMYNGDKYPLSLSLSPSESYDTDAMRCSWHDTGTGFHSGTHWRKILRRKSERQGNASIPYMYTLVVW